MKRVGLITLVVALILSISLPAFAHIATTRKWGSSFVYYYPNFPGSDAVSRSQEAANDWNSKVSNFSFRYTNPGGHTLYMGSTNAGAAATTYWYLNDDTAFLDDCDTAFNTSLTWNWSTSNPSSTQMDYLTVCKHELGHWYRLADCYDSSHSGTLMYYSMGRGVRKSIQSHDYTPAQGMY